MVKKKVPHYFGYRNFLRCAWKPGGSSLAPYFEGILDTSSSLAPFQAPASFSRAQINRISFYFRRYAPLPPMYRIQIFTVGEKVYVGTVFGRKSG